MQLDTNPKMTLEDAASYLGCSRAWLYAYLQEHGLAFFSCDNQFYFGHKTATSLFTPVVHPQIAVFHVLKGGTGKTSLAFETAIRASLYGVKVLCIDLDPQANLTQSFRFEADECPVMVDILMEGYAIENSLWAVKDGIDLLPSRIENAVLDEVIRASTSPLDVVYREPFNTFKKAYDLIIVDCPPSLDQSVTAAILAADRLIAPVTPDKFACSGLEATYQFVEEIAFTYKCHIPLGIIMNKLDARLDFSREVLHWLQRVPQFQNKMFPMSIRSSMDFPSAGFNMTSIFDSVLPCAAKEDIDQFTRSLLNLSSASEQPLSHLSEMDVSF